MPTTPSASPKPLRGLGAMIRYQMPYTVFYPAVFIFSIGLPVFMYFMFGAFQDYASRWNGHSNVSGQVMFAMGAYGATLAAASIGAQVGVERGMGFSRQLALTAMRPRTYLLGKLVLSLLSALFALLTLMLVGAIVGAEAEVRAWVFSPLLILFGSLVTACMGVAFGYLFRSDAAYGIIGGGSAILAFLAGIWIPLEQMPEFFRDLAPYTPVYGVFQLSQLPLRDTTFNPAWVANIAAWIALFGVIALWRMRRDTSRR
ncbi:MAG: ABC transporter permease [Actinomycetaceae bacterium]|nr:ABC transporter permease [Actinomycetaceae bacterium]